MDAKRIFSIILLLFAEALIIICFHYFGGNLNADIRTMNIVVSSIILLLLYADVILPRINLKDKSQKVVGILGVRGTVVFIYILLAISAMILFNVVWKTEFVTQLIIHGIFILILGIGMYYTIAVSDKVVEVFYEEKKNRGRIDEMKKITKEVQLKLEQMNNVPALVRENVDNLQENLRFLSPSDNADSILLESEYVNEMKSLWAMLFNVNPDYSRIQEQIRSCERKYKERKQQYSN